MELPVQYHTPLSGDFLGSARGIDWSGLRTGVEKSMDTLGGQSGRDISVSQTAAPTQQPAHLHRSSERGPEQADFDLLRPRLLIQFLTPEQVHELLGACVGGPSNPFVDKARQRLFRDFAAHLAESDPDGDPADPALRTAWLQQKLKDRDDEQVVAWALRAWAYSHIEGPNDRFLRVQPIIDLVEEHEHANDVDSTAASVVLLKKALNRYAEDASSPEKAALHLVIHSLESGASFVTIVDTARRAGLLIDPLIERARRIEAHQQRCRNSSSAKEGESGHTSGEQVAGSADAAVSTALSSAVESFDLSRHMASARHMSLLDQVLVRQAVASVSQTDGGLSQRQLDALIDELVRLNPNRHQTYHARGFVDALRGEPIRMTFRTANDERRAWVLCVAIIGTLRTNDGDAVMRLISEHEDVFDVLLAKPELYAGAWLMEPLYPVLRDRARFDALTKLFADHLENVAAASQKRLVSQAMRDARDLIVKGNPDRAVDLLDAVGPALGAGAQLAISSRDRQAFLREAMWRRGQAAMAVGDFGLAIKFFDDLLELPETSPARRAKVLADVGLAKAQIRRIHDVFPGNDRATADIVAASLLEGCDDFVSAINLDADAAVRSRLCLAVLALQNRSTPDLIAHLRSFLQATMGEKPGYYGPYAQAWTRFLLALAIAESGSPAEYRSAVDELADALREPGFAPPVYMCSRLASACAEAGLCSSVALLIEFIERRDPLALIDVVYERRLETCSKRARQVLLEYAPHPALSVDNRLDLLSRVMYAASTNNDCDAWTQLAEVTQQLGEADPPACARYLDFIEAAREQVADADLIEALDEAQLALWKQAGMFQPIFARLSSRVDELLREGGAYDLEYAGEVLDDLESLQSPWIAEQLAPLRDRLSTAASPGTPATISDLLLRRGSPVRIYVVGGGDRHLGYEATIQDQLDLKYPRGSVSVTFLTPGFSANWMPHVQAVERNIARFDAMVIIYATRTTFGEWVREIARKAGKPFRTCGRQGRGAVLHTIMKAVEESVSIESSRT